MLVLKLKEVLISKGIIHPHAWLMKICGFYRSKATKWLNAKHHYINLKELSVLCEMLYCTPNDLFYWENTSSGKLPDNHPCISQLTRATDHDNWINMLKSLTPDKVSELYQIGKKMNEK